MEQAPKTSFIPKQGFAPATSRARRRGGGLFSILFILVGLVSVILSVGVYLYASHVDRQVAEEKRRLAEQQQLFEAESIEALRDLDNRIATVRALIDQHVSPSRLLDALERITQQRVQFTSMQFERRPSGNVGVSLTGIAPGFNTVVSQQDRLMNDPFYTDVFVSGVTREGDGNVTFQVSLELMAGALLYEVTPEQLEALEDFAVEELPEADEIDESSPANP